MTSRLQHSVRWLGLRHLAAKLLGIWAAVSNRWTVGWHSLGRHGGCNLTCKYGSEPFLSESVGDPLPVSFCAQLT